MPECDTYDYATFISYRHCEPDASVAIKLHKAIETYRLPAAVATSYGSPKLGRVFRDQDELPTVGSLPAAIREALRHSKSLVVVCSEATPNSRWVEQEIETFASFHGRERIYAVLAQGSSAQSMPELLRTHVRVDANGNAKQVPTEPLAADMRSSASRYYNQEKLRVIAAIAGCKYDDLRQRAKNRLIKRLVAGGIAILVFASVLGFFGAQAIQQRQAALFEESLHLAAQSQQLFAQGDRYGAIETALAALPDSSSLINRPFLPSAQLALEQALEVYPSSTPWRSLYSITTDKQLIDIAISTNNDWCAVLSASANLDVFDIQTGKHLATCNVPTKTDANTPLFSGSEWIIASQNHVIYSSEARGESVVCFDAHTGELAWETGAYTPITASLSNDGTLLALLEQNKQTGTLSLSILAVESGQAQDTVDITFDSIIDPSDESGCRVCFSEDDNLVFIVTPGLVVKTDKAEDKTVSMQENNVLACIESATVEDGSLVVCSYDKLSVNPTKTAVVALDASLAEIWTRTLDSPTAIVENGKTIPSAPQCWGLLDNQLTASDDDESTDLKMLVVSEGANMHLLNPFTGETLKTIAGTKPVVSVFASSFSGIYVAFSDGTLSSYKYPLFDEFVESNTFVTNTGEYIASATYSLDGRYLVIQDAYNSNRLKAFGIYSRYDLPGERTDGTPDRGYNGEAFGYYRYLSFLTQNCDHSAYALIDHGRINLFRQDGIISSTDIKQLEPAGNPSRIIRLCFSSTDPNTLYLLGYDDADKLSLWSLDASEATTTVACLDLSQVVVPEIALYTVMFHSENDEALCMYTAADSIVFLTPRELLAEALVHPPDENSLICSAFKAGEIAVVQELTVQGSNGISSRAAIIDIESDSEIKCDLGKYSIDINNSPGSTSILCNHEKTRVVEVCSDDMLRCFNLPSGKLLWETPCTIGKYDFLDYTPDDEHLIVRDSNSQWLKIDANSGEILCSASANTDRILYPHWSHDGKQLYASTQASELSEYSLQTLSLDEDAFGITGICYSAALLMQDEKTLIAADGLGRFLLPRYSLDELIDLAHQQLEQAGR